MMVNTSNWNTRQMRAHNLKKSNASTLALEEVNLGTQTTVIDLVRSHTLNVKTDYGSIIEVVGGNQAGLSAVSDADHELIFKIIFKDPTTITSVRLIAGKAPEGLEDKSAGPSKVSFYSNQDDLDFSEVDETMPDQEATLTEADITEDANGTPIVLRGSKFQKVNSIQLYISQNQNDVEHTHVTKVELFGFVCPPYTAQHMI